MPPTGFTTEELRGMAGDIVTIDAAFGKSIASALKRALRGQRINTQTSKLLALQSELELAINDRALDESTVARKPRRRKPAAAA